MVNDLNIIKVDICIVTHKRPDLLSEALESIQQLERPDGVYLRIVIVDNDPLGSASKTAADFAARTSIPVLFAIEPRPGISAARNAALERTTSDFVAFLDDDEIAAKDWLVHLLETARTYNADIVFGPVLPILPDDTPLWIIKGGFFHRQRFRTGTPRPFGGTGNVLVRRELLDNAGRGFDTSFGLTGGGDTEFFVFLGKLGARMVWCDEAIARERIPESRATKRWLIKRHFRVGQNYARIARKYMPLWFFSVWPFQRISYLFIGVLWVLVSWPLGLHNFMKAILVTVRNFGQLSSVFYWRLEEYGRGKSDGTSDD